MTTLIDDTYTYRQLPWISKSKILGYRFCQHLFDLRYNKGLDTGSSIKASTGTNMHTLYAVFFERIDYDRLTKVNIDFVQEVKQTPIYNYFYRTCMEMIPAASRGYKPYVNMVTNFCLLETDHWIELMRKFKLNSAKALKYFKPLYCERYLECPELEIFGTLDRMSLEEDEEGVKILYDYKTGHVPADVKRGKKVPSNAYSWTLHTNKNFELHFYIILELSRMGYTVNPEIVEFCTLTEHFHKDAKFPKVDYYFYDKHGEPAKFTDLFRVGIIYTGDEQPWVPKKLASKKSMMTVFKWLNKIRTILKDEGPYMKEPSYWKCRECNQVVMKECLNEVEKKMIFWKNES